MAALQLKKVISFFFYLSYVSVFFLQFLARMKLMDYSLLLGIHDVEQAEQQEEEDEEDEEEELYHEDEDDDDENGLPPAPGSTSPQGIAGYMNSFKPMGPGEFDPYVDVYAVQSSVGEARTSTRISLKNVAVTLSNYYPTLGCSG